VKDPGLQPERTALAWSRTVMAIFVNAGLVVRSGWLHHRIAMIAIGVGIMMTCSLVIMLSHARRQELDGGRHPGMMARVMPLTIAGSSFLVSLCATLLFFTRI
jgi:hypothetical protein